MAPRSGPPHYCNVAQTGLPINAPLAPRLPIGAHTTHKGQLTCAAVASTRSATTHAPMAPEQVYANVAQMLASRRDNEQAARQHDAPATQAAPPPYQHTPPSHFMHHWYPPPPTYVPPPVMQPYHPPPPFAYHPAPPMYAPPPVYTLPYAGAPSAPFAAPAAPVQYVAPAQPPPYNHRGKRPPPSSMPHPVRKRPRVADSMATVYLSALAPIAHDEPSLLNALRQRNVVMPLESRYSPQRGGRAWLTYGDKQSAGLALSQLRNAAIYARIHENASGPRAAFLRRVDLVKQAGGNANVLMLRHAPDVLTLAELEAHLQSLDARPLRARSTVLHSNAPDNRGRAFWLTYTNTNACLTAWNRVHDHQLSLRCGASYVLRPILHDDVSTDSGDFLRRKRHLALGTQPSNGAKGDPMTRAATASSRALAKHLQENEPQLCLFIRPSRRQ